MPVPSIKRPSPTKGQPCGTGGASRGSKNTSENDYLKGIELEKKALVFLSKEFKAQLLRHRYRTPFGEVDLLLRLPTGELLMVEVKSLSSMERIEFRLGPRQKRRLKNVFAWLSETHSPVLFWLVFVDSSDHITVMDDIFG